MKNTLVWALFLVVGAADALAVRDANGGNCVGVKSCRPRCATFRLDRTKLCNSVGGVFKIDSSLNPWDIKRFRTLNCASTCINDKCGQDLVGDLTIKIGEQGYSGGYFFTNVELLADRDVFTFCSIYPCPKDECALPEQMVSGAIENSAPVIFKFGIFNLIHFQLFLLCSGL
jgi:hypothetical protein